MTNKTPLLLPSPQHLELTGEWLALRKAEYNELSSCIRNLFCGELLAPGTEGIDRIELVPANLIRLKHPHPPLSNPAAYRLTINPSREPFSNAISIESSSPEGARCALQTLSQLLQQYESGLPGLIINDAPAFPTRGVMLDISRDRVPRQNEILRVVDLLASWKFNHLQLYTEHTFAYQGHETVWRNASPFTPEEIRELDKHCQNRGITLAANQNCFGHMTRWLKHPTYAPMAEVKGEWSFNGIPRRGPFSLCPEDPRSIELIKDLLNQLRPCFHSDTINIGCDETYDVGQGRSRETVAREGYFPVYWRFVQKVITSAQQLGFKPQMWADMIVKQSESALKIIPEDVTLLVWGYEPDEPHKEDLLKLQRTGRTFWVCPGTSSWRSITGRTSERSANLNKAAQSGLEFGASGYMVTDWGDLGHRQQWPVSLIGLAEAAEAAWRGNSRHISWDAVSKFAFDDATGKTALWLNQLGDSDLELRRSAGLPDTKGKICPLRNASALFTSLHTPRMELPGKLGDVRDWKAIKEGLEALADSLPKLNNAQFTRELTHTCDTARFAAARALFAKSEERSPIYVKHLTKWLERITQEHRDLWLRRSRLGGLDDSCQYYIDVMKELESLIGQ